MADVRATGAGRPGRRTDLTGSVNRARIGRVVMARGRDAVDVALTTSFGAATLTRFTVWTDEIVSAAA